MIRTSEAAMATEVQAVRVTGGHKLRGSVHVPGFKHSMVTTIAAAAASCATVTIKNCPDIRESWILMKLLNDSGAVAMFDGENFQLKNAVLTQSEPDADTANAIHGSVYLIPAFLRHCGEANIPFLGGCHIGTGPMGIRPVEQYIDVLKRFGAKANVYKSSSLKVTASELSGCEINLADYTLNRKIMTGPDYSGASKMALLCAAIANGQSILHNLYPKPDVMDLVEMLKRLGADIVRTATGSIIIQGNGGKDLCCNTTFDLITDLIEIMTWITVAALLCDQPLAICSPRMTKAVKALAPEFAVLNEMGVRLECSDEQITCYPAEKLRPANITISSCGIYSDNQPFFALLASAADGISRITEMVWSARFKYASSLNMLGVNIEHKNNELIIHGPSVPTIAGCNLEATDLRAASVLLLASLMVKGPTIIHQVDSLMRGYCDFTGRLRSLGADIVNI